MADNEQQNASQEQTKQLLCGIVMPISSIDNCSAEHWSDVQIVIKEAIDLIIIPKFRAELVSTAEHVGVIQKRIIQSLYSSDIVVCDVSGKNPNVMFELGVRVTFDKPVVIVKDDKTDYSFDTSPLEHLTYPRDLRYNSVVSFKSRLAEKISATYDVWQNASDKASFLQSFGQFKIVKLDEKEVTFERAILDQLKDMQQDIELIKTQQGKQQQRFYLKNRERFDYNDKEHLARLRNAFNDWRATGKKVSEKSRPEMFTFFLSHLGAHHRKEDVENIVHFLIERFSEPGDS